MAYISSFRTYERNKKMFYAIGILGIEKDRVDHLINMKFIGEQDTAVMGWSTIMLESQDGTRVTANAQTVHLRALQVQTGDRIEVLIDKFDHTTWMIDRMNEEQCVDAAPESIAAKIARLHASWDNMPFHEKNLPKDEASPSTPSPLDAAAPDTVETKVQVTASNVGRQGTNVHVDVPQGKEKEKVKRLFENAGRTGQ
ncbi:MAG: hypothetical protein ABSB40_07235 [Nitrososphaeria archaeon]|jgi:hypothetical protein